MKNRLRVMLVASTVCSCISITLSGCSDSGPVSVTDGIEQSAIDEYKERERQIEEDARAEMDLDDGP